MFVSPKNIQAAFNSFRTHGLEKNLAVLEHLRTKQQQVWSSLSSTLAFNGIMSATVAVLGAGQVTIFGDPVQSPSLLRLSMWLYLASAVACLIGLNLHGIYRDHDDTDVALGKNLETIKRGARCSIFGMWLSLAGTSLLVVTLLKSQLCSQTG